MRYMLIMRSTPAAEKTPTRPSSPILEVSSIDEAKQWAQKEIKWREELASKKR